MTEIKIPVLDLKPQYEQIKDEVQAAINRVLESGRFIMGPDVKLFEEEVAEYVGVKHAISYLHPVAFPLFSFLIIGDLKLGQADQ